MRLCILVMARTNDIGAYAFVGGGGGNAQNGFAPGGGGGGSGTGARGEVRVTVIG